MDTAIDHPRLRALLVELAGLGAEDGGLPLNMLANLSRGMLRLPFRRAARGVSRNMSIRQFFTSFWPELGDGFEDWAPHLDRIANAHKQSIRAVFKVAEASVKTDAQRGLLRAGEERWHTSNPVVLTYLLAFPGEHLMPVADMLELQLGVAPATRGMLLALAHNTVVPNAAA